MIRHLLTGEEFDHDAMMRLFDLTAKIKRERFSPNAIKPLAGKSIGLIFAKSSTRTRVSFEVGVHELGDNPLYLDSTKMQLGRGETVADTANVLSRYIHGLVIRTYSQADVEELAREANFPVINALTDEYHPCQILADALEEQNAELGYNNSMLLTMNIEMVESMIWLLEEPEVFGSNYPILCHADGTLPGGETDAPLYYQWAECPVLTGLELGTFEIPMINGMAEGDCQMALEHLAVARRGLWDDGSNEMIEGAVRLWETMTEGAK